MRSDVMDLEPHQMVQTGITPPEKRRSSLYLTRFEVTRIIGERARQIIHSSAIGGQSCDGMDGQISDPIMMAKYDLVRKQIRMVVRRTWPDGSEEVIPVRELLVDPSMLDMRYD